MKINLNKQTKYAELTKRDGKVISTYSYKNMIRGGDKYESEEEFENDINEFNKYLADKDDFDDKPCGRGFLYQLLPLYEKSPRFFAPLAAMKLPCRFQYGVVFRSYGFHL